MISFKFVYYFSSSVRLILIFLAPDFTIVSSQSRICHIRHNSSRSHSLSLLHFSATLFAGSTLMLYTPHPLSPDLTAFLFFLNCLLPFIFSLPHYFVLDSIKHYMNLLIQNDAISIIVKTNQKKMNENIICLMRNQNENHKKKTNAIKNVSN